MQLFSIVQEARKEQCNYLFGGQHTIGPDGKKVHGPNSVVSMLHHYLDTNAADKSLHFRADNAVSAMDGYFGLSKQWWRSMTPWKMWKMQYTLCSSTPNIKEHAVCADRHASRRSRNRTLKKLSRMRQRNERAQVLHRRSFLSHFALSTAFTIVSGDFLFKTKFLGNLPIFSYSVLAGVPQWRRSAEKYPLPCCKFCLWRRGGGGGGGGVIQKNILLYDL